mgnify:FL=1
MYGIFSVSLWPRILAAYQELTDVWRSPLIEVPLYSSIESKFTLTIEMYYSFEVYYGPD